MVLRLRIGGAHVHVVLSEPSGATREILVVNWTTLDEDCVDDACVLQPGEHPAVHRASSMAYSRAHLWRADQVVFALQNGVLEELNAVSPEVLRRMTSGALTSPELRSEWKKLLPQP